MPEIIGGQYRLGEFIGSGGMGTVYAGEDVQNGQKVAIKRLKPDVIASDPQLVERFEREADALRRLNHPNIVRVMGLFDQNGEHYLVTEYIGGGDLRRMLNREHFLTVRRTLEISLDLADALTRTHRLDIIHRDLKPENVLIAEDGTPRLTDFGVAHFGGKASVTETGLPIGTLDYMPPEAFTGEDIDQRADIWGFGVLLYEMLTGARPFSGVNYAQVITAILQSTLPDLQELRPDAPIALVDLIYRMLNKDRDERITSVRQVGLELEAMLRGADTQVSTNHVFDDLRFALPTQVRALHNLPAQMTPFVGRETERALIAKMIDEPSNRLITVVAPGGMGKTRFALEAAREQIGRFAHGVYFVDLTRHVQLFPAIAEAVNYQFQADGRSQQTQIHDFLRERYLLLLLDNFEHMLDSAGQVAELLAAAPDVKAVVTSRQRLNLNGETLFALEGLEVPDEIEKALECSAVKLFVQSARRVRPGYEPERDDLEQIVRICRMVQGMPLAIVMAAAWLEMLSPLEIAQEIGQSVDFLATTRADVPERQRSIRVVFDYAWNRLSNDERDVMTRLSIFRGGFTREAAQTITGAKLPTLMGLVNKSLLRRDPTSGRYTVHELLRQYAEEHRPPETLPAAHGAYYLTWLGARETDLTGGNQIRALREIDADFENIRRAWSWALGECRDDVLGHAVEAMDWYCTFRSRQDDGNALFQMVRERLPMGRVWARVQTRFSDDTVPVEKALEITQRYGDHIDTVMCLLRLAGRALSARDFPRMIALGEESYERIRSVGTPFFIALVARRLAYFCDVTGDVARAEALTQQAAELQRSCGDRFGLVFSLNNLGFYSAYRDLRQCIAYLEEAFDTAKTIDYRQGVGVAAGGLARWLALAGELSRAEEVAAEGEALARDLHFTLVLRNILFARLIMRLASGDYAGARDLAQSLVEMAARNPEMLANVRTFLALAWMGLGDSAAAKLHGLESLKFHIQSGSKFLLHFNVIAMAGLLAESQPEDGAAYLACGWQAQAEMSEHVLGSHPLFVRLRRDLPEQFAVAWERGKTLELGETAAALLKAMEQEKT